MIKHILKIVWAQRKSNGWIFLELVIVICALWWMIDNFYVDMRTYYSPMGFDITNTWRFKLSKLNSKSPDYVPDSGYTSTQVDDLQRLMAQISQHPSVEDVCVTFYSCPYSYGNMWRGLVPVDGDTAIASQKSFQMRLVTKEYFDVFKVEDPQGNPIMPMIEGINNAIVVSEDMGELFYHGQPAKGRRVNFSEQQQDIIIAAVCNSIRTNEYSRSEPCFYYCMNGTSFIEQVNGFGAENAELCVRMKQAASQVDMNNFLEEMGERLTVNNLNVYGVRAINDFRVDELRNYESERSKKISLMAFLLLNVLFGIIGTFWLRTQYRQSELGLRVALGASQLSLKQYLYAEGLSLLLVTLPVTLLFVGNMIFMDKLDTYRVSLSFLRFLITVGGTYLLMAVMICLGICFPVRKVGRMAPAEALHYE